MIVSANVVDRTVGIVVGIMVGVVEGALVLRTLGGGDGGFVCGYTVGIVATSGVLLLLLASSCC